MLRICKHDIDRDFLPFNRGDNYLQEGFLYVTHGFCLSLFFQFLTSEFISSTRFSFKLKRILIRQSHSKGNKTMEMRESFLVINKFFAANPISISNTRRSLKVLIDDSIILNSVYRNYCGNI